MILVKELAEAIAAKHFTNRGFRITWRAAQSRHGIAFVAADEGHAKYVEVRFREGGEGTWRLKEKWHPARQT